MSPRRGRVIPFPGASARAAVDARTFVEVHRCDQAEALVVKGLLESEGIRVVLRSRIAQSVHPFSVGAQGEIVILVPDAERVRGRRLLVRLAR